MYYFAILTCLCEGSISTPHIIFLIILLQQCKQSTSSRLVMLLFIADSKHLCLTNDQQLCRPKKVLICIHHYY